MRPGAAAVVRVDADRRTLQHLRDQPRGRHPAHLSSQNQGTLASLDGLGVEIEQPTVRVVRLLQYFIRRAAVCRPELILRVEGGGIQRLASVEARDLALDGPVVERLGPPSPASGAPPPTDT